MLVPEHMRAMAIALVYLFVNLIGLGLGPVAVGALSDVLRTTFGADSLRYALLLMTPGFLWGAWHLRCASRYVEEDIKRAPRLGTVEHSNHDWGEADADAI
jgi:MFS transporter, Spinster family, sphingosine-1-phosphate transporter